MTKTPPRFVPGVLADVKQRFLSAARAGVSTDYPDFFRLLGQSYDLTAISRNGVLSWRLQAVSPDGDMTLIGAGWFRFQAQPKPLLIEVRAAIVPAHQRRGLYPQVLRSLRFFYNRPLRSDISLSDANKKAWAKVGLFDTSTKTYRINPKKPLSMPEQIRLAWLATEGKMSHVRTRRSRR